MEWIEVTGKSLESAKELALDRLGVSDDDLDFEVLEESRAGFLGMGRSDARIRARVKPLSREKPDDRRKRRGRNGDRQRRSSSEKRNPDRAPKKPAGGRSESKKSRPPTGRGTERAPRPDKTSGSGNERDAAMEPIMSMDEQVEHARRFLGGLVSAFELDAQTSAELDEERLLAQIDGDSLGVLIGPNAATLSAIEDLTQTVLQHASDGHGPRVRLDVNGYRAERQAALESFTRELADRVRASGVELALEPMGANDRKIVHDVIAESSDLVTVSEGEEPQRRVVIRSAD